MKISEEKAKPVYWLTLHIADGNSWRLFETEVEALRFALCNRGHQVYPVTLPFSIASLREAYK